VVKINGTENQEEESEFTRVPGAREIRDLIKKMKNNKAAGCSGIVAEMLKAGGQFLETRLLSLFKSIWSKEVMPADWEVGIVIPLYKKGDKMDLNNYRGITLMDVVGKLFGSIMRGRLERWYSEGRIA
jgi:hypothetical protein